MEEKTYPLWPMVLIFIIQSIILLEIDNHNPQCISKTLRATPSVYPKC